MSGAEISFMETYSSLLKSIKLPVETSLAICTHSKNIAKILALFESISSFNSVIAYLWQVTNYTKRAITYYACIIKANMNKYQKHFLQTKLI